MKKPKLKKKMPIDKQYVIVDNETKNYLGYISYRQEGAKIKEDTLWFVSESSALHFTSLKLANCLMNELGHCHIEDIV